MMVGLFYMYVHNIDMLQITGYQLKFSLLET